MSQVILTGTHGTSSNRANAQLSGPVPPGLGVIRHIKAVLHPRTIAAGLSRKLLLLQAKLGRGFGGLFVKFGSGLT